MMAWSKAVGSRMGCDTLRLTLARALCCSMANTSNNERDFSDVVAFKCRGPASTFLKAMERRIRVHLTGIPGKELDELCNDARKIWAQGFGTQRAAGLTCRRSLNFSSKRGQKETTKDSCQQLGIVLAANFKSQGLNIRKSFHASVKESVASGITVNDSTLIFNMLTAIHQTVTSTLKSISVSMTSTNSRQNRFWF